MGHYIRARRSKKKSVAETLQEAELEHYLDCPTADLKIRFAALLLDLMFLFILSSSMESLVSALWGYLPALVSSVPNWSSRFSTYSNDIFHYAVIVLRLTILYLYILWASVEFGGTAGKLLLGLRIIDNRSGDRPGFFQLILRELVGKAVLIPATLGGSLWMASLRKDGRCLHDIVSKTTVKRIHGSEA